MKRIRLVYLFLVCSLFGTIVNALNVSSYALIDKAVSEGKITYEQGILYKVHRRCAPFNLPSEFYSTIPEPCGTNLWLELQKVWFSLSPQVKNEIKNYVKVQEFSNGVVTFTTPISPLDRSYTYGNFVIKYTTIGVNGVNGVNSTDINPSNGIPDYIDSLAERLQNSWTKFSEMGYIMPPTPYTVNVFELSSTYGWLGETQSFDPVYLPDKKTWVSNSYMNIDNDLDLTKVDTDAHELFHAVQFRYDITEDIWWMETTATWAGDEVYDSINYYKGYLEPPSGWFACPELSLYTTGYHSYGSSVFCKYLTERQTGSFGTGIIREIWEGCIGRTQSLNAIDNVLKSKGTSFL